MTNKEKLIKLYNESLKTGELPSNGLCNCLKMLKIPLKNIQLFEPDLQQKKNLIFEYKSQLYWASDVVKNFQTLNYVREFTPLRQTILAFLIAMED